jgi:DNA-directed RNA polymerase subunit alpha
MNNISIKCLKSEKIQSGACHGQFVINSLRPGQGITIGNQLRRVLLGDLGGVAISAVRIAGVSHEFSTIPGVREDILEILLNLKGIVFKSKTQTTQFGRLKIQGPSVVTADLIQLPPNLEIVNPNHYIATISTSNILEIEFKFEYGTGYKLASQTFSDEDENYLQLDTIFMPVQKVDFKIENVYDTANNISERLFHRYLDKW